MFLIVLIKSINSHILCFPKNHNKIFPLSHLRDTFHFLRLKQFKFDKKFTREEGDVSL